MMRVCLREAILPALVLAMLLGAASSPLAAADHGTIVREGIIYMSPDANSRKLAQVERGRGVMLLNKATTGCKWRRCSASPTIRNQHL